MDLQEIRRRVRSALEDARKESAERRVRSDEAAKAYAEFLEQRAVPAFHAMASALAGEGLRFKVFTPAESVRLTAEGASEDFIELTLDPGEDPPIVLGQTSRGRGRRAVSSQRRVRPGTAIASLTEDDVVEFLIDEIAPLLER